MAAFDLYAVNSDNLKDAKAFVERVLSIFLESRESTYHAGEYFFFGDWAGEHFLLKQNLDPFDGEPAEQGFPESSIILYVNDTRRSMELRDALVRDGAVLLRHEDL
jgi:hypothetical protein